ncbi:MAG: acyl-ACP--UDP-N-acetylglucosamine O-acyltransferase [Phycisphaerales bacterium]|nr:acyl-ACP--UDP-N-acetylglucosamine O-acyltransferase [Planctomycetota bacterium]MCH8507428.1 acyl-ACP--UDP-N-acetylglucosamine O-acyltransferase [Phycisphaerales bacterium]
MPNIHPTATVDEAAMLADDVEVGPYTIVSGPVTIGPGVRLLARVSIQGPATIGAGTIVYPNACIGFEPQDYKFKPGMATAGVTIGEGCLIREHVTVHASTSAEKPTRIGNRVFMMVNSHAGHDCEVRDEAILVNNTALAGHCEVHERAILSGGVMLHQFGRVGRLAMCSGGSLLTNDVPPYCMTAMRNMLVGLNLVGMRRSGMDRGEIDAVRRAYREVFRRNPPRKELLEQLKERAETSEAVSHILEFVLATKRSITPVGGHRYRLASNAPEEFDE